MGISNGLSDAEEELLVITMEEGGELGKACSKVYRHGRDGEYADGKANLEALAEEAADVIACLAVLAKAGFISIEEINQRARDKLYLIKSDIVSGRRTRFHYITEDMVP